MSRQRKKKTHHHHHHHSDAPPESLSLSESAIDWDPPTTPETTNTTTMAKRAGRRRRQRMRMSPSNQGRSSGNNSDYYTTDDEMYEDITGEMMAAMGGMNMQQYQAQQQQGGAIFLDDVDNEEDGEELASLTATQAESLPDKFTSNAISGTLDFLGAIGGFTLNATGKLAAPPLHATRTVIIPALLQISSDWIKTVTPRRVKDWFRIFSTSVSHMITVIINTHRGKVFRSKVVNVGGDLVQVISSDASRQVLMDSTSCAVKLIEALSTPETKEFLDQTSTLGIRLVDLASHGKNKKLIRDVCDLIWSGIEVLADPTTIVAMAEVVAYLSYALEMEEKAFKRSRKKVHESTPVGTDDTDTFIDRSSPSAKAKAAQRRYERNKQQNQIYQNPVKCQDPYATVEQVILSALQQGPVVNNGPEGSHVADAVTANSLNSYNRESDDGSISITMQREKDRDQKDDKERDYWEQARKDVNVEYLKKEINERAISIEQERVSRKIHVTTKTTTMTSPIHGNAALNGGSKPASPVETIGSKSTAEEENDDIEDLNGILPVQQHQRDGGRSNNNRGKKLRDLQNHLMDDSETRNPDDEDRPWETNINEINDAKKFFSNVRQGINEKRLDGETPVEHFYRILDEVLVTKREEQNENDDGDGVTSNGIDTIRRRIDRPSLGNYNSSGDNDDDPTERVKNSKIIRETKRYKKKMKNRNAVSAINSKFLQEKNKRKDLEQKITQFLQKYQLFVAIAIIGILLICIVWFLLGCYGVYAFLFPTTSLSSSMIPFSSWFSSSSSSNPSAEDVVVRVIREVVHVNENGEIIKEATPTAGGGSSDIFADQNLEKFCKNRRCSVRGL